MMQKTILLCLFNLSFYLTQAQIVSLSPSGAGPDDSAILIFDASEGNGELIGANTVYAHHGIVTNSPDGTNWSNVIGNWGQDDGIGEMTPVTGEPNKWQLEFTPSIRDYFGAAANDDIYRISIVFRSADGNTKATIDAGEYGWGTVTPNLDIYVNLNVSNFVGINSPFANESYLNPGQSLPIEASASGNVSSMKIWIDEGSGYNEAANVTSGNTISYNYMPISTIEIGIKITATINGEDVEAEKMHNVTVVQSTTTQALPAGMIAGINYHADDNTKATLVLEAPGKTFAYVVGDFNNWLSLDEYQMKGTPDGEFLWLELNGLSPMQEYVFQYWIDGEVKIGDPYAEKIADPWNDQWIDPLTYPNLPVYTFTDFGKASVLQTDQSDYQWAASELSWQRPDIDHVVIYELLVRDFLDSHSWADLKDTLSYIKGLGVDAIELMPFNEFEGNESWGYNPSYYFAPDKYYGPKEDLKLFIETAHQMGLAVIMDAVMNHAYGQNPMVKMYFDAGANSPTANNPWFNQFYVGQYQWGYDWNHESTYTKNFLDRLNKYWIEEYHVDGYRFDFTKGFTNHAPGGSIDGFDQSRIDLLKRMADEIWATDNEAYIILEHWAPNDEEQILADYGMKLWKNRSYDYVPVVIGNNGGNFNNMDIESHVSFFDSHDEQRMAYHAISEGLSSNGTYDVRDPLIMYERMKMAAAFAFLFPGPKMLWQFDELGYDIDIDFNGRIGNKPLPWGSNGLGYYEDSLRQYIYDAYQGILDVRKQIGPAAMASAVTDHTTSGSTRGLSYNTANLDLVVIGNFSLNTASMNPKFTHSGDWYNYFSGDSINISNTNSPIELKAGEWHIYTDEKISNGFPGVVETYDNPVTIAPYPFTKADEITITFDATKAFPNGTAGLVDAEKVYIHSGVVLESIESSTLENIVGTLMDDGIGEMTEVSPNIWEITITPKDYYNLDDEEDAFRIGMYFRDAANVNQGMGFRNRLVYFKIESDKPFITIEPAAFTIDDEITVTFNAKRGNGELIGSDKVYMHSSVDLVDSNTPQNTAWGNVVGDWGQDNGIGEMTELSDEPDTWEISFVPKDYYNLSDGDIAYWLAAVFRSADGNVKGTGTPGPIENGFIHDDLDFFIQNQLTVETTTLKEDKKIILYPNPALDLIHLETEGISGKVYVELLNSTGVKISGKVLQIVEAHYKQTFDISHIPPGLYFLQISGDDLLLNRKFINNKILKRFLS